MENEIRIMTTTPFQRSLPQEILIELLLRLPVKSLLRFRCVSKPWLSLISSYDFAKAHLKVSATNNNFLHDKLIFGSRDLPMDLYTCCLHSLVENPTSPLIYPAPHNNLMFNRIWFDWVFPEPDDVISLVGSCNGLVCVDMTPIVIWNPTTRKQRMLPDSGTDLDVHYYGIGYGFGYDELHDDYKVVESFDFMLNEASELAFQVKVYSMRTNSWKTLSNWPCGCSFGGSSIFLNGAIHWSVSCRRLRNWGIVSLSLENDTFLELPMPNFDGDNDDYRVEINVVGGCLAVCRELNVCMDVWVMKEYGIKESWTKLIHIPFFLDFRDHEFLRPQPLFLWKDGKILMNYGSSLRIYDSNNPQNHNFDADFGVEATTYIESLVSPDLDNGMISEWRLLEN